MHKVHILPPEIVSKIAAGEVIERPASVIKELVENALDAGADTVEVHLKSAGKASIAVRDNGGGIARDDMEHIFRRHATSKIARAEDLFAIHSLGFRGEALYSVAAVSDVTLKSRTDGDETGWEIHLRGGERKGLKPCTSGRGTEITVRELFFNTPARRKFLKSDTAEMNQVLKTVVPYTLLYPQVRFCVTHGEKTVLETPPADDFARRAADVLHLEPGHLVDTSHALPDEGMSARLVLGDINIVRSRRDMQFVFINGRPVESKSVSYHLNDIYRLILPPGYFPFFIAYLRIAPAEVDVNIHPTKREVKIRNEGRLVPFLRSLCEQALMTSGGVKEAGGPERTDGPSSAGAVRRALGGTGEKTPVSKPSWEDTRPSGPGAPAARPSEQYTFPASDGVSLAGEQVIRRDRATLAEKLAGARYIGTLINKFLLFETGRAMLVMDQHAAQERITYEGLIRQMEKGKVEVQQLLTPYVIKLSVPEIAVWEEAQPALEGMGFSTTRFDEEAVAVHTHPGLIRDPQRAVLDILAGGEAARSDFETLARRACRASIMAGDKLAAEQAEGQRQQLLACKDPFTCPHGRPTIIELSENFLDKQFLRT